MSKNQSHSDPLSRINNTLDKISRIQKESYKTLHNFGNHSQGIATRASKIQKDVSEWERALTNLNKTRNSLVRAAEAYNVPSCVSQVLEGRDKSADGFCESLQSLTRSKEYLESHLSNPIGENLEQRVDGELDLVIEAAEQHVVDSVIEEMQRIEQKRKINEVESTRTRTFENPSYHGLERLMPSSSLFESKQNEVTDFEFGQLNDQQEPDAASNNDSIDLEFQAAIVKRKKLSLTDELRREDPLAPSFDSELEESLASIVNTLYSTCDRRDLAETLLDKLVQHCSKIIENTLPPTYSDDYETVVAGLRPYKKNTHPLLLSTRLVRTEVKRALIVIEKIVLTPMEEDFEVIGTPAAFLESVLDVVVAKMCAAITKPMNSLRDTLSRKSDNLLQPFALGGNGCNDLIFMGLNFLEELWPWRNLAAKTPGDSDEAQTKVDDLISESVSALVTEMLGEYELARGMLSEDYLSKHHELLPRAVARIVFSDPSASGETWSPPNDCMVHPLTATVAHFFTNIFTEYFGALKIVLGGEYLLNYASLCTSSTAKRKFWTQEMQDEVLKSIQSESQQLLFRCLNAHAEDIITIGVVARKQKVKRLHPTSGGSQSSETFEDYLEDITNFFSGEDKTSSDVQVCNPTLLMLNNYFFLIETFTGSDVPRSIIDPVIVGLRDEYNATKELFAEFWTQVLPPFFPTHRELVIQNGMPPGVDFEVLCSISEDLDETEDLSKEQRWVVKQWMKAATMGIKREISNARHHTLMDRASRPDLLEKSVKSIQVGLELLDQEVLFGREWSSRPEKWFAVNKSSLVDEMSTLF